jgi:hypothetical protein
MEEGESEDDAEADDVVEDGDGCLDVGDDDDMTTE